LTSLHLLVERRTFCWNDFAFCTFLVLLFVHSRVVVLLDSWTCVFSDVYDHHQFQFWCCADGTRAVFLKVVAPKREAFKIAEQELGETMQKLNEKLAQPKGVSSTSVLKGVILTSRIEGACHDPLMSKRPLLLKRHPSMKRLRHPRFCFSIRRP
jgi:hypothetical protein